MTETRNLAKTRIFKRRVRASNPKMPRLRLATVRYVRDHNAELAAVNSQTMSSARPGSMSTLSAGSAAVPVMTGLRFWSVVMSSYKLRVPWRRLRRRFGVFVKRKAWTISEGCRTQAWMASFIPFCWSTFARWGRTAWWRDILALRAAWSQTFTQMQRPISIRCTSRSSRR